MQDPNCPLKIPIRSVTEASEHAMNKFERVTQINKARLQQAHNELLQKENMQTFLKAFPQSKRHYRYHSVVRVSIDNLTSYEKNLKFLKRMKRKVSFFIFVWPKIPIRLQ